MATASVTALGKINASLIVDEERADFFLEEAASLLSANAFGTQYARAVLYLAAFLLTNFGAADGTAETDTSGPVTSKKAGDVSESYGESSTSAYDLTDAFLSSNKYGRMFLFIRNTRVARMPRLVNVAA